jgi:hypothetical protein
LRVDGTQCELRSIHNGQQVSNMMKFSALHRRSCKALSILVTMRFLRAMPHGGKMKLRPERYNLV